MLKREKIEIFDRILSAVKNLGGSHKDLLLVLTNSSLVSKIAELIIECKNEVTENPPLYFKIIVDFEKSITEMLRKYDWYSPSIAEDFQIQGQGQQKVEVVLIHMNRFASRSEVLDYLDSLGLIPAKIEHLLALGVAHPELQKKYLIHALGSSHYNGNGYFYPSLAFSHGNRSVHMTDFISGVAHRRGELFLALHK